MKKIIFLLLCLGLFGCATAYRMNSVSLGMSKEQVLEVMGEPVSTSAAIGGMEYLNYKLYETRLDRFHDISTPYTVYLQDGKVISYGRYGDFGKVNVNTE